MKDAERTLPLPYKQQMLQRQIWSLITERLACLWSRKLAELVLSWGSLIHNVRNLNSLKN